jgi:hypothetical protein
VYYLSLCEQVFIWYRDYLSIDDVDEMGLEIAEVIRRFIKDETISKVPQDKDGFFKYLSVSIKNEKGVSRCEYNENEIIRIPKGQKRKLRELEDFVRMTENNLGRKLTNAECEKSISKWFKKQEYINLLNVKKVGSISYTSNDGENEIDALNYVDPISNDPQFDEYILNRNIEIELETVKSVLNKKQDRSRDCYRALFTLFCVKNNLRGLYSILDQEIIDAFYKNDKKPKQYEIYLKYHPETDRESAEAMASKNLKELLNEIETCLKEKNL